MERWIVLGSVVALAGCSIKSASFTEKGELIDAAVEDARGVPDASPDARPDAAPDAPPDAPPPLGSKDNPARSCTELKAIDSLSGVYWVKPNTAAPFQAYCEQALNGGGWALLENSVRMADGSTLAFWQLKYAQRFDERGTMAPTQNYYNGALYKIGTRYFDYIVDLEGNGAIAAEMTATGINETTMRFTAPEWIKDVGLEVVFNNQFKAGWSALDYDGDDYNGSGEVNCAKRYADVSQHYGECWAYDLGADGDSDRTDGGVGPHANNASVLKPLGLQPQDGGGSYHQVNRIARFVRW